MRICYLNHDTRGNTGAGQFYNSFSTAVKKIISGVEIEALTSENILYPNKLKLLLALPAIRRVLRRCDLIHALDGWPYGVVAALANIGLKKPFIITAIGTGAVQPFYSWWKRPIMKWAYRKADKVVAVSNSTKKEILKFLPDLKIEIIHHGVDFAKFQSIHAGYQAEAQKLKPYVLSIGSLKKRKGFNYSIEAFAKIAKDFPDLKYVVVGGGPEREALQLLITNYKLQNRVIFLENIHPDYVSALYQNAELFILLSQDDQKDIEGFGLVFLEAAACGLPVVATKNTSAEDAIADGKNGFLVPPKDSAAAAEMMKLILNDRKLKESFAKESISFANSMTWAKAATAYYAIYQNVADTRQ